MALLLFGEYLTRRLSSIRQEAWIALRVNALGFLLFTSCLFLFKVHDLSRTFSILYFLVEMMLMLSLRLMVRLYLGFRRKSGTDLRTRVIVGLTEAGQRYHESTLRYPGLGLSVSG